MKKVVVFALIAALCAGALLYFYLGNLEAQKQVEIQYDSVAVAATDIPAYTPITAEMVTIKQVPQGYAHPLAAHTAEEVIGYVTESEILQGEELLPAKLKQYGQSESGLSYNVPEGMRAVTVSVDEVSGVAGFLQRGDYVDVIAYTTTSFQTDEAAAALAAQAEAAEEGADEAARTTTQSTTLVAAQNVCIAAVGTSLSGGTDDQSGVGYASVTLLLTPEDAMRVIQGSKGGSIVLVLRALGDHAANEASPVVNDSLLEKAK